MFVHFLELKYTVQGLHIVSVGTVKPTNYCLVART